MSLKVLLSPAKKLDESSNFPAVNYVQPELWVHTEKLAKMLKKLSVKKISALMDLSLDLSQLNYERYQDFQEIQSEKISKPAVFAFNGEVYNGLNAKDFSDLDLAFAQENIRILSGLYGILKPLDFIQAYRLEMGTKLPVGKNKNLYEFWGSTITKTLKKELRAQDVLVNLASTEYFKAIKTKEISNRIVTPTFKEFKNGDYKVVMIFAKNARGSMANYMVKNKISDVEQLKNFTEGGYEFNTNLSSENDWVFTR